MNSMMYIVHWVFLRTNATFFKRRLTRTVSSLENEMIRSYTMTAPTTTSKLSRKMVTRSMVKAKNTDQTRLFKWGFLQMEMGFHWHFPYSPEIRMSRLLFGLWRQKCCGTLAATDLFIAVMQVLPPKVTECWTMCRIVRSLSHNPSKNCRRKNGNGHWTDPVFAEYLTIVRWTLIDCKMRTWISFFTRRFRIPPSGWISVLL